LTSPCNDLSELFLQILYRNLWQKLGVPSPVIAAVRTRYVLRAPFWFSQVLADNKE